MKTNSYSVDRNRVILERSEESSDCGLLRLENEFLFTQRTESRSNIHVSPLYIVFTLQSEPRRFSG